MRKYIVFIIIFALQMTGIHVSFAQQTASDTIKLSDDLIIREIEKDVYCVTHFFPYSCNSLLCKLSAIDYILVDTPYENQATQLLVEWIKQQGDSIHLRVINTHFHRDNLGGNAYLLDQHIPVYGSDLTARLLTERINDPSRDNISDFHKRPENRRYYDLLKKSELKPPDHQFPIHEGLQWHIGDEILELFHPGAGHTRDNIVVYLHSRQVLFCGCLLKALNWNTLGYIGDADLDAWPETLRTLLNRFPESRIVIPGHGDYGDMSLIHHTLKLLENRE